MLLQEVSFCPLSLNDECVFGSCLTEVWFSVLAEAEASLDGSDCSFFHITSNLVETQDVRRRMSPTFTKTFFFHQASNMLLNELEVHACSTTECFKSVHIINKALVGVSLFVRRA